LNVARQLRAGRSRSIGLIVLDVRNPFFTDVARGAEARAAEVGMTILLGNSQENPVRERAYLDLFEEQRVRGILITPVADVVLHVPAAEHLEVDPDRLLPVATHPVEGTAYDFREPRPIGDLTLDTAFTGLDRDSDGRWAVTLSGLATGAVSLWGDEAYAWTQVFTGRAHPHTEGSTGIAVEPMTCPPDALSSGADLVVLRPEQSHTGSWGIRPA